MKDDKRRAPRVALNVPTVVSPIGQPAIELHESLGRVYERVQAADTMVGDRFPGVVRDLSTNGAFVSGEPLPLLSRVRFSFTLEQFGVIDTIGWVLWRRSQDCELPGQTGESIVLPQGFGVLFEAIPLDARLAIHKLIRNQA